jgi:O-antigen/teichoic acid export membrane protein
LLYSLLGNFRLEVEVTAPLPGTGGNALRARFASGIMWSLLGALGAQGSVLVASIVIARVLGRAEFGEFGMVQSTVMMLGVFADFGQGLTATKYVAELRDGDRGRLGRILSLSDITAFVTGGGLALSLYLSAPWIASSVLAAPHLADELQIAAIVPLLAALTGVQTGTFTGLEAFRALAAVNVVRGMISFPILIGATWYFGLRGAVIALVAVSAIGLLISRVFLIAHCRRWGIVRQYRACLAERHVLWRFSFPALLASVVAAPVIWYCNALLVNQPHGYEELGLVTAARQWQGILTFLPHIVASVTLPILASLTGPPSARGHDRSIEIAHLVTQGICWALVVPIVLVAPWIMGLYGSGFREGQGVLVLLVGGTALGYLGNTLGSLVIAQGRMWLGALQNGAWALAVLGITVATVERLGGLGLALSYAVAYAGLVLATAVYLMYCGSISTELGLRCCGSAVAMGLLLMTILLIPGTGLYALLQVAIGVGLAAAGLVGGTTEWSRTRLVDAVQAKLRVLG